MIIIFGTFRINVDAAGALLELMAQVIEHSRAEDGCVEYAYAEDVSDPGLFRVHEQWRNRAALTRHFTTDHMRNWVKQREAYGFSDRDLKLVEAGSTEQL